MANGVVILWIPLQGPAVRRFGLGQFALRKIQIGQIRMIAGLIEMMNAALQFLNPAAIGRTGQFEASESHSAAGRCLRAIHHEVVKHRAEDAEEEDTRRPNPLFTAQGIHHHPKLESSPDEQERVLQGQLHQIVNQAEHSHYPKPQ